MHLAKSSPSRYSGFVQSFGAPPRGYHKLFFELRGLLLLYFNQHRTNTIAQSTRNP